MEFTIVLIGVFSDGTNTLKPRMSINFGKGETHNQAFWRLYPAERAAYLIKRVILCK